MTIIVIYLSNNDVLAAVHSLAVVCNWTFGKLLAGCKIFMHNPELLVSHYGWLQKSVSHL